MKVAEDDSPADWAQVAEVMIDGRCNAAVVQSYLGQVGDTDLHALAVAVSTQARAIAKDDLGGLEHMLLTQATALQAMFTDLALRAKRQDRLDAIQTLTNLALKCAAQSRQSIEALGELRVPKSVMFAKQANINNGGQQQVNNGVVPVARVETGQAAPSEQSGLTHELLSDARASGSTIGAGSYLEAVDALNRAEVRRG